MTDTIPGLAPESKCLLQIIIVICTLGLRRIDAAIREIRREYEVERTTPTVVLNRVIDEPPKENDGESDDVVFVAEVEKPTKPWTTADVKHEPSDDTPLSQVFKSEFSAPTAPVTSCSRPAPDQSNHINTNSDPGRPTTVSARTVPRSATTSIQTPDFSTSPPVIQSPEDSLQERINIAMEPNIPPLLNTGTMNQSGNNNREHTHKIPSAEKLKTIVSGMGELKF